MNLKELKEHFITELSAYYEDENELLSHFWIISEELYSISRLDFALNNSVEVDNSSKLLDAIKRLKKNEPIQHITEKAYFFGNEFIVSESVLIPRPETEELVQWIINDNKETNLNVLDIATGSSCIAVCLDKELTEAKVSAIDISESALKVAKKNISIHKSNVNLFKADALDLQNNDDFSNKKWDVIVSNPPYVKENEKNEIKANVLDFEPHLALFVSDNDPLKFYREIMKYALTNLNNNGLLYFEINQYLLKETSELAISLGFKIEEARKDFRGNDRMIKLIKN